MLAAVVSVIVLSLLGFGAISGLIPSAYSDHPRETQISDGGSFTALGARRDPATQAPCGNCGTVGAIRTLEINGARPPDVAASAPSTVYRITVRMDDGSFRALSQSHAPGVAVGDRVRITNGSLVARS